MSNEALSIVRLREAREILKITVVLSDKKLPTAAAVALTEQLPTAVNIMTAVDESTVQPVVPALSTA